MVPALSFALALAMTLATATDAAAADRIRLAVQRTGTLAWELDVIKTHGIDRKLDLKRQATIVYGAPPLLSEKALQGETDATLTFWNFCADLESKGFKPAIAMADVMQALGAKGPVAIVGYTFDGGWAARNRAAVDRFLLATRQAKEILTASQAEWLRLAPRIRAGNDNALAIY